MPQERKRFKNKNIFKEEILKTKYFKENNLFDKSPRCWQLY
jgi:hypothetical protein